MEENKETKEILPPRKALGNITNIPEREPEKKISSSQNIAVSTLTSEEPSTNLDTPLIEESDISLTTSEVNQSSDLFSSRELSQWDHKLFELRPEDLKLLHASEYHSEILETIREAEQKNRPRYNYLLKQTDINDVMRRILVSWIVEVQTEYQFQTQTLYLAVNYLDRFLSLIKVKRAKLQLIGTCALFIATKYEEIYFPDVREFCYLTDNSCSKEEALKMEKLLLKVLQFELTVPTSYSILKIFCVIMNTKEQVRRLAEYLCELTLYSVTPWLALLPSRIATASLVLASFLLDEEGIWNEKLMEISNFQWDDIKNVVLDLNDVHREAIDLKENAIQVKYTSSRYLQVALIPPRDVSPEDLDKFVK